MTDPLGALLELPGVTDAVADARAAVDALLGDRTVRRRSADVSAESTLRGAWAAAALCGSTAELADVRIGAASGDPVVQGALRCYAALGSLADTWAHAPRQALARLHALAAADLVDDPEQLGRPTAGTADRLDTLSAVLAATEAPAPVVAAVVHAEVLALDAFAPASGLVALAAARLTLIGRGLDPRSLVVIEVGHRDLGADYPLALAAYRDGGADGLARWLRHCCAAIRGGAAETAAICAALTRG